MLRYFPVQNLCISTYLIIGNFRVNLRGLYPAVPEHFADRFKGDSVGERDFCRVGMPRRVKDQRTVDVADLGNLFQVKV